MEISQLGGPEDSSTDGVYVRGLRAVGRPTRPFRRPGVLTRMFRAVCIGLVVYGALTSCQKPGVVTDPDLGPCCAVDFTLELVNGTGGQVRVQLTMMRGYGDDYTTIRPHGEDFSGDDYSKSGIVDLDAGERRLFLVHGRFFDASAPYNLYVGSVGSVQFYHKGDDAAYKSYVFVAFGCGTDLSACDRPIDDAQVYHRSSAGTADTLFIESSDRPFYLERDKNDSALGRVMITSVPTSVAALRGEMSVPKVQQLSPNMTP